MLRRVIIKIVLLFAVLLAVVAIGDWLNWPLWPVDFLNPNIPVEIQFRLVDFPEKDSAEIFRLGNGVAVQCRWADRRKEMNFRSDDQGVALAVLPIGPVQIHAVATAVFKGKFYGFAVQSRDGTQYQTIDFSRDSSEITIDLHPIKQQSEEFIQKNLLAYLGKGDFDSAYVLAHNITPDILRDIERLVLLRNRLDTLPVTSYNSSLKILDQIDGLLNYYLPDTAHYILLPGETIDIQSRKKAILQSRNAVIQSYINLMDAFSARGRLELVAEQWENLTRDSELVTDDPDVNSNYPEEIYEYKDKMPDIQSELLENIHSAFNECVRIYDLGDMDMARKHFTRLRTYLIELGLNLKFPELSDSIESYLDDIAVVTISGEAMQKNKLQAVLLMLDIVVHPNALIQQRIEEAKRLMALQGIQPETNEQEGQTY